MELIGLMALGALGVSIYRATRNGASKQTEINALTTQIAEHKTVINALQQQSSEQWMRLAGQDNQIAALKVKSSQLESLNAEQAAIIRALQRQLGGLASDSQLVSKKLRELLTTKLNEADVRTWASDLNIDFESLQGGTVPLLIISLLDTLKRYGRLAEGLAELRISRPDIETANLT